MVKRLSEIDAYINAAPRKARPILSKLRAMARDLCPDAQEVISYNLPALRRDRVFLYYAAFKNHIGIYPPVRSDSLLITRLEQYRGPKGNLQFPYSDDVPYALIGKVITALHEEYAVKK